MAKKTVSNKPVKSKLNASQKIAALENQVLNLEKLLNTKCGILADEIDRLGEIVQKLTQRINAAIQAGEEGDLSMNKVDSMMIDANTKELVDKVNFLIASGVLHKCDGPIDGMSFIVAKELKDGKVINSRLQFAMPSISEELQKPFIGKKIGDQVTFEDSDIVTEIIECYQIKAPNKDVEFENEEVSKDEKSEEAAPEQQDIENKEK